MEKLEEIPSLLLKGEVVDVNKGKNFLQIDFDLAQSFKDPEQERIERKVKIDGAELVAIKLERKEEEIEEKERTEIAITDFEKGDNVIVELFDSHEFFNILSQKELNAKEVMVFKRSDE